MQTNLDLVIARSKATFDVEPLTHWLDGGIERTIRRRHFLLKVDSDPIFDVYNDLFKDRVTRYRDALRRARRLKEMQLEMGIEEDIVASYTLKAVAAFDDPTQLHELMFVPNIEALCTSEQRAEWLPQCRDWRVIGCYAQTEVGHGSNVRGLETTATYLKDTDEFELQTPTPTASKFWPGSLGRTANTAMVIARLITNGTDQGIHNFLVPIRDRSTHETLPGVTVGDIGPKLGFNNMDNGYLQLESVRIPRKNMAARFAHVDPSTGAYVSTADSATRKLAGLTMTQVRAHIICSAGRSLAQACTVAIRYSTIRRQGFAESGGGEERSVLEYATQRHRLLPLLASAFCFHVGGLAMANLMARTEALVKTDASAVHALLPEVHALSSGLKALCTGVAADGIETCRRACGGHGYLLSSGLPVLLGTYLQSVTVEGDNYLLPQQTARFLIRAFEGAKAVLSPSPSNLNNGAAARGVASALPDSCAYFASYLGNPEATCAATSLDDFLPGDGDSSDESHVLRLLVEAFDHRAGRLVAALVALLGDCVAKGMTAHQAWVASLVEVGRASHAHCQAHLLRTFVDFVTATPPASDTNALRDYACIAALRRLCIVFGLNGVEMETGDWLEGGFLSSEQAQWVRAAVRAVSLSGAVVDDSVALCDAWDFADRQLQSTLGRKDGQVYTAVLDHAQRSPLNTELKLEDYRDLLRPLGSPPASHPHPRL